MWAATRSERVKGLGFGRGKQTDSSLSNVGRYIVYFRSSSISPCSKFRNFPSLSFQQRYLLLIPSFHVAKALESSLMYLLWKICHFHCSLCIQLGVFRFKSCIFCNFNFCKFPVGRYFGAWIRAAAVSYSRRKTVKRLMYPITKAVRQLWMRQTQKRTLSILCYILSPSFSLSLFFVLSCLSSLEMKYFIPNKVTPL